MAALLLAPTLPAFPMGNLPLFSLLGVMSKQNEAPESASRPLR